MNKNMVFEFFAVWGMGCLLSSCDANRVYENYRDFEDSSWKLEEEVSFNIQEIKSQSTIPVVSIRYTDTYEFHNLYLRFVQEDSTPSVLQDTLVNIAFFDSKTGRPLGKGFGNRHTVYDTLLGSGRIFPETTQITIWQYMRKDRLEGIESVGIKLLNEK